MAAGVGAEVRHRRRGENAALDQPYANQPGYQGELQWEPAELADAAGQAVRHGWKVGVHAWGDRAVRAALDAFEAILADQPGTPLGTLVLEHAGLARPDQRARAVRLGIPVTIQYPLLSGLSPALVEYWGQERTADIFPLREWLDEGRCCPPDRTTPNQENTTPCSRSGG